MTATELQTQPALFAYESLEPDVRADVQESTARLHELERRTSESIIEIGRQLLAVKERLGHGHFLPWLSAEFGWTRMTAHRFIVVAEQFGDMSQLVTNASPSALYALAAESTPEFIRTDFIERAESGESIRHKDVAAAIAEARGFGTPESEVLNNVPKWRAQCPPPSEALTPLVRALDEIEKLLDGERVRLQRIADTDFENMGLDELMDLAQELDTGIKRYDHLIAITKRGVDLLRVRSHRRMGELLAAEVQL